MGERAPYRPPNSPVQPQTPGTASVRGGVSSLPCIQAIENPVPSPCGALEELLWWVCWGVAYAGLKRPRSVVQRPCRGCVRGG